MNDHTITVTAPPGRPGAVNVVVSGRRGTSPRTRADRFTYTDTHPVVTGLSPRSGPAGAATVVTVSGGHFNRSSVVRLDRIPVATTFVSSTVLRATVHPAHPGQGNIWVSVANPVFTSRGLEFTYVRAPSIGAVSPRQGPVAGGNRVTVTGSHFGGVTRVDFGARRGARVRVLNDHTITVTAPPGRRPAR